MHRALTFYACGFTGVVKVKNLPINYGIIAIPWPAVLFSQCCLTWQARFKMPGAQGLLSVTQVPLKSKSLTHKNKARIHSRLKNKRIAVRSEERRVGKECKSERGATKTEEKEKNK